MFNKGGEKEIESITPAKMKEPFTTEEVKSSVKSLKKR